VTKGTVGAQAAAHSHDLLEAEDDWEVQDRRSGKRRIPLRRQLGEVKTCRPAEKKMMGGKSFRRVRPGRTATAKTENR
jgi:hypothetical protein